MRVFTLEEFNEEIKNKKQWIIANNYVYDVTDLIRYDLHPGSIKTLIRHIGKDCTEDYEFHRSKYIWKKYLIGKINTQKNDICIIM